jgi:hypothetical protein
MSRHSASDTSAWRAITSSGMLPPGLGSSVRSAMSATKTLPEGAHLRNVHASSKLPRSMAQTLRARLVAAFLLPRRHRDRITRAASHILGRRF